MIPITRKDHYLNEIVGWGDTAPEKPYIEEEFFFAAILGEAVQTPEPLSRYQIYLAKIAGRNISVPKPLTRLELFLAKACGMDIETPTPITREEIFWSNYSAIVDFEVEGVPPLTYKAIEGTLENYRIYGNTVDGESVGDRTGNLFDKNSQSVPGFINDDGDISMASYSTTTYDFISVDASADYTYRAFNVQDTSVSNVNLRVAFYNSDKAFISRYFKNDVTLSGNTIKTPDDCRYIRLSVDDNLTDLMFIEGATIPTNYEPYGYKVPVTVSNGTDTLTTPIYLPEQIRKVGDEAEYISYADQKLHRVGADDIDVTLPELPVLPGTNTLTVGTEVQPSKVYIKYEGAR